MTWSLVLGGAKCVFDDLQRALDMFGEPDVIIGVKDIWIEYPRIDHVATFHLDRIPRELEKRRKLGYKDPQCIWTFKGVPLIRIPIPIKTINTRGGSSGFLGALAGRELTDKVVLAGIPLDPTMPHYHDRRRKQPFKDATRYLPTWEKALPLLQGRVKSMSGNTKQLLGEPTKEWLYEIRDSDTSAASNSPAGN